MRGEPWMAGCLRSAVHAWSALLLVGGRMRGRRGRYIQGYIDRTISYGYGPGDRGTVRRYAPARRRRVAWRVGRRRVPAVPQRGAHSPDTCVVCSPEFLRKYSDLQATDDMATEKKFLASAEEFELWMAAVLEARGFDADE